ncbi:hypothetical protein [Leisingera sp. McT4-56]|uniref:hypothetical protein n=1 Tax=Leisingera sp. McT4-56 TaxID=2881255 RepID=UPI001CF8C63B|nr:hypothetical protein [Leisingera sp. McT4-56]MCB4456094.1 hypothetical protein [Leisingera sp. McT4-56]
MAWAGIFLGMIAGLAAAVLSFAIGGLPLWASLLMYPAAGTAVAVAVIAVLVWRSFLDGPDGQEHPRSRSESTAWTA